MSKLLYRMIFRWVGVREIYDEVVVQDRLTDINRGIRADLQQLLIDVNEKNPFFRGAFTEFLKDNAEADDATFFAEYAKLPTMSKQDYAEAGTGRHE